MSYQTGITVTDFGTCIKDAFGRIKTSQGVNLFDSKQGFDYTAGTLESFDFYSTVTGTGAISKATHVSQGYNDLTVGAAAGLARRRSYRYFSYQPGKGQSIAITAQFSNNNSAALFQRVGYFDGEDGIFLSREAGANYYFTIRTNTSGTPTETTHVARSSWDDKMDGTGPSGVNLNLENSFILWIDFQYLAVGTVRFGFNVNGNSYCAYQKHHAGNISGAYMANPNLPVTWEIEATGAITGTATMKQICVSVSSDGGRDITGRPNGVLRTSPLAAANTTSLYVILAIRIKDNYKNWTVTPEEYSLTCDTSATVAWELILNPAITGTALSFTDMGAQSPIEYDISRTDTTTAALGTTRSLRICGGTGIQGSGGGVISVGHVSESKLGHNGAASGGDVVALCVRRTNGGAENYIGSIGWREYY